MEETAPRPEVIENEINTGIIITGAYADKLRRTLFAQLRDYVRRSRECAREAARASGEINKLLYVAIVETLKSDKGDAVRIRVKYRFDPVNNKISWDYGSLRVEFFKRQPDNEVESVVRKVIETRLKEIVEQFGRPTRIEETKPAEELVEIKLTDVLGSADPIGETSIGGLVFKLSSKSGEELGIASVEPRGEGWIVDAIIIHSGKAYRIYGRAHRDRRVYESNPDLLVKDIATYRLIPISTEDAEKLISGKMGEIT